MEKVPVFSVRHAVGDMSSLINGDYYQLVPYGGNKCARFKRFDYENIDNSKVRIKFTNRERNVWAVVYKKTEIARSPPTHITVPWMNLKWHEFDSDGDLVGTEIVVSKCVKRESEDTSSDGGRVQKFGLPKRCTTTLDVKDEPRPVKVEPPPEKEKAVRSHAKVFAEKLPPRARHIAVEAPSWQEEVRAAPPEAAPRKRKERRTFVRPVEEEVLVPVVPEMPEEEAAHFWEHPGDKDYACAEDNLEKMGNSNLEESDERVSMNVAHQKKPATEEFDAAAFFGFKKEKPRLSEPVTPRRPIEEDLPDFVPRHKDTYTASQQERYEHFNACPPLSEDHIRTYVTRGLEASVRKVEFKFRYCKDDVETVAIHFKHRMHVLAHKFYDNDTPETAFYPTLVLKLMDIDGKKLTPILKDMGVFYVRPKTKKVKAPKAFRVVPSIPVPSRDIDGCFRYN